MGVQAAALGGAGSGFAAPLPSLTAPWGSHTAVAPRPPPLPQMGMKSPSVGLWGADGQTDPPRAELFLHQR